jgi:hypothetical protein
MLQQMEEDRVAMGQARPGPARPAEACGGADGVLTRRWCQASINDSMRVNDSMDSFSDSQAPPHPPHLVHMKLD